MKVNALIVGRVEEGRGGQPLRMALENGFQCFGCVGDWVNVVQFARRDDRREQGPIFGPDLASGEQRILARKSHWSDGVFNRVGIQFKAAVLQEPGKAGPVAQRVTDVASQRAT